MNSITSGIKEHPEDKLFQILSRPTVFEMRQIYSEWSSDPSNENWTIGDRRKLFKDNGWTLQEFVDTHNRLNIKLPHD